MKIDEFKATLNQLAYTATNTRSGIISVYTHNYWGEDDANGWCFRLAPARKTVIVEKQWDKLDGMPVFCVRDLLNLIAELEKTPINERFPEKKYRLVVKRETSFHPKYVSNIITGFNELVFDLSKDEKEARIFSEKELNQIKGREPSLAPAIDAMKKPAEGKGDEN